MAADAENASSGFQKANATEPLDHLEAGGTLGLGVGAFMEATPTVGVSWRW